MAKSTDSSETSCEFHNTESISDSAHGETEDEDALRLDQDEDEASHYSIQRFWQKRMKKSDLFLPLEIKVILPIWMQFIKQRCNGTRCNTAEKFYLETAIIVAKKFRRFDQFGWECLDKAFVQDVERCYNSSDEEHTSYDELVTEETIEEQLHQAEYLIKLSASSDFAFHLTKIALSPKFKLKRKPVKAPYSFQWPKSYLRLDLAFCSQKLVRRNLLNGLYDDYILPLAMAKEVNDDFWRSLKNEYKPELEEISEDLDEQISVINI